MANIYYSFRGQQADAIAHAIMLSGCIERAERDFDDYMESRPNASFIDPRGAELEQTLQDLLDQRDSLIRSAFGQEADPR